MFLISGNLSNFFLFNFFIVLFLSDANTTRDDVKSELLAAISSSLAAIATTRQRFVRSFSNLSTVDFIPISFWGRTWFLLVSEFFT